MNSWVKLSRNIRSWKWYHDETCVVLYIHLLTECTWRIKEVGKTTLNPGEALTSLSKLSTELNKSTKKIRTALKKLETSNAIKIINQGIAGTHLKVNNFTGLGDFFYNNGAQQGHNKGTKEAGHNTYDMNYKCSYKKNNNKYKNNNIINKNINNYNAHTKEVDCYNNSTKELSEEHKYRCGIHL